MSALLSEQDLNDFISPGLACIKPAKVQAKEAENESGEIEVGKESNELEKVSITLQDCLACVGCITSSEEILLSRQSYTVFLENWESLIKTGNLELVVSLSPQSRVSLSEHFDMELKQFDIKLFKFFQKQFDCKYIVGTQIGREITIVETNKAIEEGRGKLCSVCPGFVLYCEKSKPELVPMLVNVKSPQQFTGQLIKNYYSGIYHLSLMPCFDKKLEASREDSVDEVDCVITPKEFLNMLTELGGMAEMFDKDIVEADDGILRDMSPKEWGHWESHLGVTSGSSSGGYAYQYILNERRKMEGSSIVTVQGKNSDVVEYHLVAGSDGTVLKRSCELYGFRNIQNMVRKLGNKEKKRVMSIKKRTASMRTGTIGGASNVNDIDFIEVMACPKGCINGGGLVNDSNNKKTNSMYIDKLNRRYHSELPALAPPPASIDPAIVNKQYEFHTTATDDAAASLAAAEQMLVAMGSSW